MPAPPSMASHRRRCRSGGTLPRSATNRPRDRSVSGLVRYADHPERAWLLRRIVTQVQLALDNVGHFAGNRDGHGASCQSLLQHLDLAFGARNGDLEQASAAIGDDESV